MIQAPTLASDTAGARLVAVETVKLSVLIPVFNWDIAPLLLRLLEEADGSSMWQDLEVIILDDASTDYEPQAANDNLLSNHLRPGLHYSRLERNVGRSAVRNMLAAKAKGEFLLFLDCDVLPDSERFLRGYLERAQEGKFDVVCGGVSYRSRVLSGKAYDYHAYLGKRKEVKRAADRNREPWRHILTSNIMVRKRVFVETPFDERFTGYGYEDIEWGVRLAQKCRILHIDNTASHLGLVSKDSTYSKMRNSVPNYLMLEQLHPAAFEASAISKAVRLLGFLSSDFLRGLDRTLGHAFISRRVGNGFAFVLFQLNFAVLLALAKKTTKVRM